MTISPLSPSRQIAFHQLLVAARKSVLIDGLSEALAQLDPGTLKRPPRRLYGAGPLDIDYQGTNARAASVKMTSCQLRRQETERRSTRTGQAHSIGGFIGTAEYEGDLAEFLPYLQAARWTGVGRQSVWGKREIKAERIG